MAKIDINLDYIPDMDKFLQPNYFVDADHESIAHFVNANSDGTLNSKERLIELYYAIRDGWHYNPYHVSTQRADYRASNLLFRSYERGGHCIDKANLLAACARILGVPSRLHFANVRNHIGTEKFEEVLQTNLMVFHGYVELWLDDKWVAATPAFNKELCERLGVAPLAFDGETSSIFQEYDRKGGTFMQYEHDYGSFADIPFDLMVKEWKHYYPHLNWQKALS